MANCLEKGRNFDLYKRGGFVQDLKTFHPFINGPSGLTAAV